MTIKEFDQWKEDYGLVHEPNYSLRTEMDCLNAFKAGQRSKQEEYEEKLEDAYKSGFYDGRNGTPCEVVNLQQEIDKLKAIIAEALAVYDRPMCDETALYQRDEDIWHILTENKFI